MILTHCPACAAPLHSTNAKQCSRCKTRYCGPECQKKHWEEGGHDKLCRKIRKGGGAEQFHADTKYTEAVAVAAKECAEDTKGQTCYICTQALHWKTKEGLVRMCACRGTAGFAHVSCLAEQAKILVAEAEENNLDWKVQNDRFQRWHTCGLCEQMYHGVVECALSWACWKTYVGRPEDDWAYNIAISVLGNGLASIRHHKESLSVREAELSMILRTGGAQHNILIVQGNMAIAYEALGQHEEVLRMRRKIYSGWLNLKGEEHYDTLREANNLASSLLDLQRFEEAKSLLRRTLPVARRVGTSDELTLKMNWIYARVLYRDADATLDDLREAVSKHEELERTARRVLGGAHPDAVGIEKSLRDARAALRAREAETVRVADRAAAGALQRDLYALRRRLLAAREAGTMQVAECDALQRDLDAIQRRLEAREAPFSGDASSICEAGGPLAPGDA